LDRRDLPDPVTFQPIMLTGAIGSARRRSVSKTFRRLALSAQLGHARKMGTVDFHARRPSGLAPATRDDIPMKWPQLRPVRLSSRTHSAVTKERAGTSRRSTRSLRHGCASTGYSVACSAVCCRKMGIPGFRHCGPVPQRASGTCCKRTHK